ncbi:MAG: hypothetical protein IJD30_00955 [Clostridia bacterium]|nr:hypothetical protein [Clostridia bacterium]
MCIIAIKKKNVLLPDENIFETMFKNNSDGAGFMYNLNGRVIIQKGYMTYDDFKNALNRLKGSIDVYHTAIVFHFRIATHGSVCKGLCHPFPLSDKISILEHEYSSCKLGIVHNGIISSVKPRKGVSDTMEYIVSKLYTRAKQHPDFYKSKKIRKTILNEIDSKMAFLDGNGDVYTVGNFIEDNGILYSNESYKEITYNFKYFDYCTSFIEVSPLDEGYIISNSDIIECEYGQYFIDKNGRIYEYDFCYDFAYEIKGTAYTHYGLPVFFNEDNSICINAWL